MERVRTRGFFLKNENLHVLELGHYLLLAAGFSFDGRAT
jgi:hypothetical protein